MSSCPKCGWSEYLHSYPLPDRTGERVVLTQTVNVSPGAAFGPRRVETGTEGVITGARWPRGYSIDLDDGAKVALSPECFRTAAPEEVEDADD